LVQLQAESHRTRPMLDAIGAIIHSIADGVIVTDRSGAILIANPAAQRLIGLPSPDVIGAPLEVWLKCAVVADEREQIKRSIQTQTRQTGVKVQWTNQRTLSLSLAPVQVQADHHALGVVVVCHDLTREAELDRLKSQFISMVSHELRTPIGAIVIPDLTAVTPEGQRLLIECEWLAKHSTVEERRNKWGDLAALTDGQFHVVVPGGQQQRDLITEISQWITETSTKHAHLSVCQYLKAMRPEAVSPWTYTTAWALT
jgi:PAS domain S-box-containing protein